MQWLVAIEMEDDPIPACRVMNVFRRKGVKVSTLTLAAEPAGTSMIALVETPESEIEHIFNFLRRTEGVRHVTCFRPEISANATFLLAEADPDDSGPAHLFETFPGSKLVFRSQGKFLLEIPAGAANENGALAEAGRVWFARAMSTREAPRPELCQAPVS
jgi:acetolactate synthase regulatory subunit